MYDLCHKRSFSHIKKPVLAIFDGPVYGMCVGKGKSMIILFTEEHSHMGDLIDTILHELAHAEQAHDGGQMLDNSDHKRRVGKAWKRFITH
jgi:hypothetical protein